MTLVQLKKALVQKIQDTEDSILLEDLNRLFDLDSNTTRLISLNKEQMMAIKQGETDYEKGDFFTEEQAEDQINQWLED